MPRQFFPAPSLRSAERLPAARALFLAANNLICMVLWSIGRAIIRVAANFVPALREGRVTRRRRDLHLSGVPAFLRSIVLGAGFDPAFAGWGLLALPERRFGLQPVDQEIAGGEGRLAVAMLSSAPRPSCTRSARNRSWRRGRVRWGRGPSPRGRR